MNTKNTIHFSTKLIFIGVFLLSLGILINTNNNFIKEVKEFKGENFLFSYCLKDWYVYNEDNDKDITYLKRNDGGSSYLFFENKADDLNSSLDESKKLEYVYSEISKEMGTSRGIQLNNLDPEFSKIGSNYYVRCDFRSGEYNKIMSGKVYILVSGNKLSIFYLVNDDNISEIEPMVLKILEDYH